MQVAKGGAFVVATSLLLYFLVKRHSIKLQEKEAYQRSLLDSQTYFLIRVDRQDNFTFVNQAFCRKYGYQEKDIIGRSYEHYLLAEDHEKVKAILQTCISDPGRIVPVKTHRCDRQGKRFTNSWEFVAVCYAAGKVVELQGVGEDVTEQQVIHKQLSETKERLEHILSTMDEVVWSAKAGDLSIHYINAACQQMTGHAQQEFYQDKQLWMKIIHPEDRKRVAEAVREFLIRSGKDEVKYRIIHKDGSIRYLHKKAILIKDKESNTSWINGVCSDVTASKMIEQQERENARIREDILESMTDAFVAVDKQWNFTYVNQVFERITGVKRDDLLGDNISDAFGSGGYYVKRDKR